MPPDTAPSLTPMQLALRRIEQLNSLHELGRAMNAGRSRAELVETLLEESARGVAAARTALLVVGAGGELKSEGTTPALVARAGQGLVGAAAQRAEALSVASVRSDPRFDPAIDSLGAGAVGALLVAPVRGPGGAVVAVLAGVHEEEDHFDRNCAELLDALAGLAAAILRERP